MRIILAIAAAALLAQDKEYFPAGKGTEWTYLFEDDKKEQVYTCEGTKTIDEVECIVIKRADKEECLGREYFGLTDDGVVYYGSAFGEDEPELDVENPRLVVKFGAKKGVTWEAKDGDLALAYEHGGEEEIEVPAGKYKAVKIVCRYKSSIGETTLTEWYAKGVGMVKSLSVTKMDKEESKVSRVLKKLKTP